MQKTIDQMKEELHDARRDLEKVQNEADSYSKITAIMMDRHYKTLNRIIAGLIVLVIICLGIIGYLSYVLNTTTEVVETTWTQEGDWNAMNDNGTMINGDYPVEVIEDGQAN